MNNNNLYNINSWIGTTHQDFFHNSSNNLYFYTSNTSNILSNQIIITSNIIENDILITSNILENHSSNYTSNLKYNINQLINEETEHISFPIPYDKKNTYIYNSNLLGEIRFHTESSKFFPPQIITDDLPYRTKIGIDGKLYVYYTYDNLISATLTTTWLDVANILGGIFANNVNVGLSLGALQAEIVAVNAKEESDILNVYQALILLRDGDLPYEYNELARYRDDILRSDLAGVDGSMSTIYSSVRNFITTRNISYLNGVANNLNLVISRNPTASFFLGIGGIAFGFAYGIAQMVSYNGYLNSLMYSLTSNSNLTSNQKIDKINDIQNIYITSNYVEILSNVYQIGLAQGFLNSNTINQQYLNSINTNELKLNQTNISNIFVASNVLSNININHGFLNSNITNQQYLNSININELKLNQTNISNIFVASNVLSNINLNQGFINSNIINQQYISNLKTDNLILNNGNISNINGISTNEMIASGKIKQNGILLDNTYLTSNHIYNLAFNYTAERQYPSKLYTSSSIEGTATILNKLVYKQTLFLDTSSIAYGSGFYEVYSSSTFDNGITTKDKLFNFNTTETTTSPRWAISLYNSGTGNYQGDNSIDNIYFGDWVILKLPQEILLTRYRIYQRTDFLTKAPAEWKCYGSKDGIIFNEITEGHQLTRLTSYTGGFYEKTLNSSFTTQYQYIGFVFNNLLSTSGQTDLSFAELQIFGKEIISNSIVSNIYATSNAVREIIKNDSIFAKHYGFYITISTPIVINSTTFYKYDIDLRPYTKLGVIQIGPQSGDTFRSFKIRVMFSTMFFSYIINDLPNVCYYEVFMSYKNTAAPPGVAGLNACSIGFPPNPTLQAIMPNNLFVIKNGQGDINYITIVSTSQADVRVIIEDLIG